MEKKNLSRIFLLIMSISLFLSVKCYIVFPFKTSYKNEPREFRKINEIKKYWTYFNYYTDLYIGEPPQKMMLFISSQFYHFAIINKLYLNIYDTEYKPNKSKTYIEEIPGNANKILLLNEEINCGISKDTLHLLTANGHIRDIYGSNPIKQINIDKYKPYKNMTFFYSPEDNGGIKTAGQIGLNLVNENLTKFPEINLFRELKEKNYIKSSVWSIRFNDDSYEQGIIVLGSLPHEYDSSNYFESDYYTYSFINESDTTKWKINITSFYLSGKKSYNKTVKREYPKITSIILEPNLHLIHAPLFLFYELNELFFNKLYAKDICGYKRYNEKEIEYIIFCEKRFFKQSIKEQFPSTFFSIKEFNETFEIDFENLFQEKGDLVFLLIIFKEKFESTIRIGHLLLQDYLFTFDPEKKEVGYYKTGSLKSKRLFLKLRKMFGIKSLLIIIAVFGIIIFLFLYIDKRKKARKLSKDEDDESYNSMGEESEELEFQLEGDK